jgi:hypothetical protein
LQLASIFSKKIIFAKSNQSLENIFYLTYNFSPIIDVDIIYSKKRKIPVQFFDQKNILRTKCRSQCLKIFIARIFSLSVNFTGTSTAQKLQKTKSSSHAMTIR